jgi:hypothetical protein
MSWSSRARTPLAAHTQATCSQHPSHPGGACSPTNSCSVMWQHGARPSPTNDPPIHPIRTHLYPPATRSCAGLCPCTPAARAWLCQKVSARTCAPLPSPAASCLASPWCVDEAPFLTDRMKALRMRGKREAPSPARLLSGCRTAWQLLITAPRTTACDACAPTLNPFVCAPCHPNPPPPRHPHQHRHHHPGSERLLLLLLLLPPLLAPEPPRPLTPIPRPSSLPPSS